MTGATPSALTSCARRRHRVKLVVDEWERGAKAPSSPQYNLSQQSTMRDLLTDITFDIFRAPRRQGRRRRRAVHQLHCQRSRRAISSTTPTCHVFRMYLPHHGRSCTRRLSAPSSRTPWALPSQVAATAASPASAHSHTPPDPGGSASLAELAPSAHSPSSIRISAHSTEIAVRGASVHP
jgi:hypothetical protein